MRKPAAFIDLLFLLLLMLLILPHEPDAVSDDTPPGVVIVEIRWPDGLNTDVDLWVLAPGDRPVGYSNRAGTIFNLLRDDLGLTRDPLNLNYENAYSRAAPKGEYIVNVHLYNDISRSAPIKVICTASVRTNGVSIHIFTKTVTLLSLGQEITVARFSLNDEGNVVPGSIHDMPKELRPAGAGGPGW